MEYTVVFDVLQSGYRQWWFPALGLIPIAIGIVLAALRRRSLSTFVSVWLAFAILWTGFAFVGTYTDYRDLASDLHNGRCHVVEGAVTDLHSMPPGPPAAHKTDWFMVGGEKFEVSGAVVSAGFNQMQKDGSPLREGMHVRIHESGGQIARLEIGR